MRTGNSRRGGVLFGLLAAGLRVFVVITCTGLYIAHNIRVATRDRRDGADVSIDLPGGHFSVRAHDKPGAVVAGVPNYPGARMGENSGGNATFEWSDRHGEKDFAVTASDMITDDSVDQVADFYRQQLPNWIVTKKWHEVHMEFHDGGYKRIVSIEAKRDGTHIGVASFGKPASN
jgi:hypothetical protein